MREFVNYAIAYRGDECLIWPGNKKSGLWNYGLIREPGTKHRKLRVHVIVCEAAHGPRPSPTHIALHICGCPPCVAPMHLRWGTTKENKSDEYGHGTINRGERNGSASLTVEDVRAIRAETKLGCRRLARKYGVQSSTIRKIKNRERWAWLD